MRPRGSGSSSLSSNERLSVPMHMNYAPILNGRSLHQSPGGSKMRPQSIAVMETKANSMDFNTRQKPGLFDMRMLAESLEGVGGGAYAYGRHQEHWSLEEALENLMSALEDCRGHYPELQKLEEQIQNLDAMIKVRILANLSSQITIFWCLF